MISTHTPKMFNARIKSPAVAAKIEGQVSGCMICSQTTDMRKEMWAAPINAADIKRWREVIVNLPDNFTLEPSLPAITDPQLKQLLIPVNWRKDSYVSVTPVASMGVIHEVYQRLYEQNLPFRNWIIQPKPAAMANHGEALLMQSGTVNMLRRGVAKVTQGSWKGNFLQLTARCEGMNISSGMVSVGFPALTAIGGFVHSLERKAGVDIEFSFGMKSSDWRDGVPKINVNKTYSGSSSGRIKGNKITPIPGYSTEEVLANCEIVLLLKTKNNLGLGALRNALLNTHRLAGGRLFDVNISEIINDAPEDASYLLDASADISRKRKESGTDSLQAALEMYGLDGRWVEGGWHQPRNGYTLNHTGYAFLEQPVNRDGSRGSYLHAWAEPTLSLITQGSMTENCWWSRISNETGVFWRGTLIANS